MNLLAHSNEGVWGTRPCKTIKLIILLHFCGSVRVGQGQVDISPCLRADEGYLVGRNSYNRAVGVMPRFDVKLKYSRQELELRVELSSPTEERTGKLAQWVEENVV
jgi:hypothetical protein